MLHGCVRCRLSFHGRPFRLQDGQPTLVGKPRCACVAYCRCGTCDDAAADPTQHHHPHVPLQTRKDLVQGRPAAVFPVAESWTVTSTAQR